MPIDFFCSCGRQFRAKDDAAGREFPCPACNAPVVVPEPSVFRPADPPPAPPKARKPFYKDPVILIGAVFPALALIAFGAYLLREHSRKAYRTSVLTMKADADYLFDSNPEAAYNGYLRLLEFVGPDDPGDDDCRRAVFAARKNRDHLRDRLRPVFAAREEKARVDAFIANEMERLRAEQAKYAGHTARISGGAWIVRKTGNSEILRGLTISVLPATMPKEKLKIGIDILARSERAGPIVAREYAPLPDNFPIDLKSYSSVLRLAIGVTEGNSLQKYEALASEKIWPAAVKNWAITSTVTSIDGKYEIKQLAGGSYYLCARWASDFSYAEWMVPLKVDRSGDIAQDLFNENSFVIQNKFD